MRANRSYFYFDRDVGYQAGGDVHWDPCACPGGTPPPARSGGRSGDADDLLREMDRERPCAGTVTGLGWVIPGEHASLADCGIGECRSDRHDHDALNRRCPGRGYGYSNEVPMQSTGAGLLEHVAAEAEARFGPDELEQADERIGEIPYDEDHPLGGAGAPEFAWSQAAADEVIRQPRAKPWPAEPDYAGAWDAYIRSLQGSRGDPARKAAYQARRAESGRLSRRYEYAGLEPRKRLGLVDGGSGGETGLPGPLGLWVALTWTEAKPGARLAVVPLDVLREVYRVLSVYRDDEAQDERVAA